MRCQRQPSQLSASHSSLPAIDAKSVLGSHDLHRRFQSGDREAHDVCPHALRQSLPRPFPVPADPVFNHRALDRMGVRMLHAVAVLPIGVGAARIVVGISAEPRPLRR
eukprot:scaffold1505_cov256-Pinguiococcus_pyrenoidosus.AAC.9